MQFIERALREVSLREFSNNVPPLELSVIDVTCPYSTQMILRMCVCSDGNNFKIPNELNWIKPLLIEALTHQKNVINADKQYCYITVRHDRVSTVTDDEWHVDGFSTRIPHVPEQNYIWSNTISTEYTNISVEFPEDFDPLVHNVNTFLQEHISTDIVQCKEKVMYCLDPYILHRRPPDSTGKMRTFVRISFVPVVIDDVNNTPNALLPLECTKDGVLFRNNLLNYKIK